MTQQSVDLQTSLKNTEDALDRLQYAFNGLVERVDFLEN